jgi:hypothetical protein
MKLKQFTQKHNKQVEQVAQAVYWRPAVKLDLPPPTKGMPRTYGWTVQGSEGRWYVEAMWSESNRHGSAEAWGAPNVESGGITLYSTKSKAIREVAHRVVKTAGVTLFHLDKALATDKAERKARKK